MTQEEKLEQAKSLYKDANADQRYVLESLFPELRESEDERIRKVLIGWINLEPSTSFNDTFDGFSKEQILAWLEKQGEKEPADEVEPMFKVGDWIIDVQGVSANQIIGCEDDSYYIKTSCSEFYLPMNLTEKNYRLWTIQEAKDGDVLAFDDETIVIFKDLYNSTTFHSYCHIEENAFGVGQDDMPDWWEGKGFHPATKEQRDLLFSKMKEAGYEWDAEKKKLKKIEDEEPSEIRKHLRDIIVKNFPVENLDNRIYSLHLDDEALDKASEELLELAKKEMEKTYVLYKNEN